MRLASFAAGVALKAMLKRLTGRAEPAWLAPAGGTAPARRRRRRSGGRRRTRGAGASAPRRTGTIVDPRPVARPLLFAMLGSAAIGVPLMVLFENTITRVVGVLLLGSFIICGVFLIADPAFLESEEE